MKVVVKANPHGIDTKWELWKAIEGSRFKADLEWQHENVKIVDVRLREKKPYCGNHPNGCDVRGFGAQRRPKKQYFLEGADWVEFNDLINDVLDTYEISANVYTSVCKIRLGRERRVRYRSHPIYALAWDKKGEPEDYEDHCGKLPHPQADFPFGTPGIYQAKGYEMEGHPE